MMKYINRFLLRILRYKIDTVNIPPEAKKCVLVFAPHTSMNDFIIGRMSLSAMGVRTFFVIKKEAFFFPIGVFLRALGGIPVDRTHVKNFTNFAANLIKENDEIAFLIAPEGTRAKVTKWKKGFYYIAQQAQVPIVLGYLDYKSRRGGIGPVFHVTGDVDKDMEEIRKYYYGMKGLVKNRFDLEDLPYAHPDWLT